MLNFVSTIETVSRLTGKHFLFFYKSDYILLVKSADSHALAVRTSYNIINIYKLSRSK